MAFYITPQWVFMFNYFITFYRIAPFLNLSSLFCCFWSHLLFTLTRSCFPLPFFTAVLCRHESTNHVHCLFCCFTSFTWLYPMAELAKHRTEETALNSVICQPIQPRKLHCSVLWVRACLCLWMHVQYLWLHIFFEVQTILCVWSNLCMHRCMQSNNNSSLMCHLLKCLSSGTLRLFNWEGPWLWTLTALWLAVSAIQWRSFKSHHLDWQIKGIYRQVVLQIHFTLKFSPILSKDPQGKDVTKNFVKRLWVELNVLTIHIYFSYMIKIWCLGNY